MKQSQTYLKKAREDAKGFDDKGDPELLKEAYLALENVLLSEEEDPETRSQLRRESLDLWLQLIQSLDRVLDPNFDPEDMPDLLVEPPSTSDGISYRPGTDPTLIKDPELRAKYEKAIADNEAKTIRYGLQIKLRRLDERIIPRAEEFIQNYYTPDPGDREELKVIIEKNIRDPRRNESLLRLLNAKKRKPSTSD